jgi:hypothetical protein
MERLTEQIKNKETGEILAYRLFTEVDRIRAYRKLGELEDLEEKGELFGRWIPCSERLPEDRKEKLVYLSTGRITVAIYNEHRLPHSGYSIGWGYRVPDGYIDFEKETVIAWMPLPEPYKGE